MKQIIVDDGPEGQLSEKPAIEQLIKLGYEYISGDEVAGSSIERNSLKHSPSINNQYKPHGWGTSAGTPYTTYFNIMQ